jgi:hypothetical protein
MKARDDDICETIDHKTSRYIWEAVGERLQQRLQPTRDELSPDLKRLLDEMRRRDQARPTAPSRRGW